VTRRRGFTLLEVLIAIAILVLAIAAIVPLFAVGTAAHRRGMDQSQVSWIAPRIAARIQERLTDLNPEKEIRGYVKEREDGSLLIDTSGTRVADDPGATYRYRATLEAMQTGDKQSPMPSCAFLLKVEILFRDREEVAESYETVVLRKLLR
jgi:prepilin-type N-terminal cleavage/methylation domain-containing protein